MLVGSPITDIMQANIYQTFFLSFLEQAEIEGR